MVVRADAPRIGAVAAAMRRSIVAEHPGARARIQIMSEMIAPAYRPYRTAAALFSAFGVLAFAVAMIGVFSTVSYTVSQRTHEFGIRMTLGATIGDVLRAVVSRAMQPVVAGLVIGIVVAAVGSRALASLLFEVSPTNPAVMIGAAVVLLASAILASIIPAMRASRVDPVVALRVE